MKGCDKISYLVLLIIFPFILSYPQEQQYKFRHITPKDGLSSHYVRCIIKDSRGFMWFGTANGLNRYDGYNIKTYYNIPDDSTSISGNYVLAILEDTNGDLLIGTT
jgi:ligand-binding sensor domain-containing protein